jgi:2-succinyl-6-hydroxy-2,4-cyclohexadiene-1-carboxylate synthase
MTTLSQHIVGNGPKHLALVHGFTQTGNSMLPFAQQPDDQWTTHVVDAPNHGDSHDVSLNMAHGADALVETVGEAIYLGYSMGARLCLHAALQHPEKVRGLVLVSGTAGIRDDAQRLLREKFDNDLGQHIETIGVAAFISEWLAKPMFTNLKFAAADIADRCRNTALGLSSSLRLAGTGAQQSLWPTLHSIRVPVLIIAGKNDTTFCDNAEQMGELIGSKATVSLIDNCGHCAHLEQPEVFSSIVVDWLEHQTNR